MLFCDFYLFPDTINHKTNLFADDTTYFIDGTINSFTALINAIKDLSEIIWLKTKYPKINSNACWFTETFTN